MPPCEKCWADAYGKRFETGKSQSECYRELLEERNENSCSPKEQAGEWWDEEKQCDSRNRV